MSAPVGVLHARSETLSLVLRVGFAAMQVALLASCGAPGDSDQVIKIGLVAPFEGQYRYVGYDVIYAVRLALREVNSSGGAGGYRVELVAYDDMGDPESAVEQARKLQIDSDVLAVVGHFRHATTEAAAPVYNDAGIALVAPAHFANTDSGTGSGMVLSLAPDITQLARQISELTDSCTCTVGLTDDGVLWPAFVTATQEGDTMACVETSFQSPHWRDQVTATGADCLFIDLEAVAAGEAVAQLRSEGWGGRIVGGPALSEPPFASVAGDSAIGVECVTGWPISAAGPDFDAAYRAVSAGTPPGPMAALAYEATWILIEAVERTVAIGAQPSRSDVAQALTATQRQGLVGTIVFRGDGAWVNAPICRYRMDPSSGLVPVDDSPRCNRAMLK
ncbi:MAG: ABC transporter substrate-binding protein [Chloroflexi bacterium]|nr:ABC transporter substrate-binding protein [Chloroflexota bacterium]